MGSTGEAAAGSIDGLIAGDGEVESGGLSADRDGETLDALDAGADEEGVVVAGSPQPAVRRIADNKADQRCARDITVIRRRALIINRTSSGRCVSEMRATN